MRGHSHEFCDLYLNVDTTNKMVVYTDRDNNQILLALGSKYWEIGVDQSGDQLNLLSEQSIGSDPMLKDYSLAMKAINTMKTNISSGIAFYKVLNVFHLNY